MKTEVTEYNYPIHEFDKYSEVIFNQVTTIEKPRKEVNWQNAITPPSQTEESFINIKLNNDRVVQGYYSYSDKAYIIYNIADNITNLKYVKAWANL